MPKQGFVMVENRALHRRSGAELFSIGNELGMFRNSITQVSGVV